MQFSSMKGALAAAAFATLAGSANAQWSDNFDSYPAGAPVDPGGLASIGNGWESWSSGIGSSTVASGAPAPAANSAPNSLSNNPGSDTVNNYGAGFATSGDYVFRGFVYHPNAYSGRTYWIMLNTYNFGGPYDWSVQTFFDGDQGLVDCDCANMNNPAGPEVLQRDAWVPIRAEIDLTNDVVDVFYDNVSLTGGQTYVWTQGVFGTSMGILEIQALDLYPDVPGHPNTTAMYYDDLSLGQAVGPIGNPDPGCSPLPNSIGGTPSVNLVGSGQSQAPIQGQITGGKPMEFGYWISGPNTGQIPAGCGIVCIGTPQYRYNSVANGELYQFDANGVSQTVGGSGPNTLRTDNTGGAGAGAVPATMVGETRSFQGWYRDAGCPAPNQAFNFTNSVRVTFN